ncbi:MAG TPA: hypothetical protein DEP72_01105 [Clostridiales bacterium]|nr:MAG: hypothetical protein A2Y18_01860 [Clostridiales bacterium GWD2_32_19]HCC06751.1 hypothetical protein [Clostridiales bacterium]
MDILIQATYSLLIIIGVYLIGYYIINQEWFMKMITDLEKSIVFNYMRAKKAYKDFMRRYIYKEDGPLYVWYKKFLMHTKFSVEGFMNIKVALFVITIFISMSVKTTDILVYTDELYTKFQYEQDEIMKNYKPLEPDELEVTAEFKKVILKQSLLSINKEKFESMDKNETQDYIIKIVKELKNPTPISDETLSNEVYYKLKKFYDIRKIDFGSYLMIAAAVFFVPEIFILLYNFFIKVDARRELAFMKRLIIMNGSIKPVDFMEVLKYLIKKSTFYTKILEEIQDKNKKNYLPNTQIYLPYIRKSKSITEKLFFEKLDEANNYDFDQAIQNIKNEFNLDKRTQGRKIKKTVEVIHIWGIVGFMGLIVFIIMYLILPWMSAYKMDTLM